MSEINEERWQAAYDHVQLARREYSTIPTGVYALNLVILPAIRRYEEGERTEELLEEMEAIAL